MTISWDFHRVTQTSMLVHETSWSDKLFFVLASSACQFLGDYFFWVDQSTPSYKNRLLLRGLALISMFILDLPVRPGDPLALYLFWYHASWLMSDRSQKPEVTKNLSVCQCCFTTCLKWDGILKAQVWSVRNLYTIGWNDLCNCLTNIYCTWRNWRICSYMCAIFNNSNFLSVCDFQKLKISFSSTHSVTQQAKCNIPQQQVKQFKTFFNLIINWKNILNR